VPKNSNHAGNSELIFSSELWTNVILSQKPFDVFSRNGIRDAAGIADSIFFSPLHKHFIDDPNDLAGIDIV
jgi:hypothetical protein